MIVVVLVHEFETFAVMVFVTEGLAIVKVIDVVIAVKFVAMMSFLSVLGAASLPIPTVVQVFVPILAQSTGLDGRLGKRRLASQIAKMGTVGVV